MATCTIRPKIQTADPYQYCALSITNLGSRLGNKTESRHVIIAIHDRIAAFRAQPAGSTPDEFDIIVVDILLEMIPQENLTLELAIGALMVLDALVYVNDARNLRAIIICNGVSYATMGIDFLKNELGVGNASLALNVTAAR